MIVRFRSEHLQDSVDWVRTNLKTHNLRIFVNEDMTARQVLLTLIGVVKELEAEYCKTVESECHLDKVRLRIVTKLSKLPCLVMLSCSNSDKKCNVQNLVANCVLQ